MSIAWSEETDAVLAGDLAVALGYRTPAGGVVVQAVAPIGLRDAERGTVSFTTSLGFSKKLERIAADPRVALAYHTRVHGTAAGSQYVLVQGSAQVIEQPSPADTAHVRDQATIRLGALKRGRFWDWWLREYVEARVRVEVSAGRIATWNGLAAPGLPSVSGEPWPDAPPPPQDPPRNGIAPRIDVGRAARRLRATEYTLVGYAGADGLPVVLPVEIGADSPAGIELSAAGPLPAGGRRAGLLGHSFRAQLIGLETRQHTGWLSVGDGGRALYAPHTEVGYRAPPNKTLLLLLNGGLAKRGVRQSRRTAAQTTRHT